MDPKTAYDELIRRSREIALLGTCSAVLGWDEQTYMPRNGADHRGEQLALLAGLQHDRATEPRIGELLDRVETTTTSDDPDAVATANIRELRRGYDRRKKLPKSLVEELARETSIGQQIWAEARTRSDFGHFRPCLARIVALKRQEAACLGSQDSPYDALLDDYEPGTTAAALRPLFDGLRQELVPLVAAIGSASLRPDSKILDRDYPVERQKVLGELAASTVGFDFRSGRLDTAAHPFCTGLGPGDTRITTRYDPRDLSESFFGILHEVGHGLYDQGLDPVHAGTPMGEAVSLGVHESQSRLWENAIGRSAPFWDYFYPIARGLFPAALGDVSTDAFLFAINEVKPSLIRTQADEVTYNLHIMIRFELEQALLSGDLVVEDVPSAWNAAYRRDLGLIPPNDAQGCLQDIHWSAGLFGYFPTYTLGNLYAAQLMDAAHRELGDLDGTTSRGDFRDLLGWLRERIHRQGQRYRPARLIKEATGQEPEPAYLVKALRAKYGTLYGI